MELTRTRLLEIDAAMRALDTHTRGVKIAYAIAKNLGKMRSEIEAIQRAGKMSKEFTEYNTKRAEIASGFAAKNKDGEPVVFNNNYVIADQGGLSKAIRPLKKEYAKAITEREKQQDELDKFLEQKVKIEFHKIPADLLEAEGAISEDTPGLAALIEPLLGIVIDEP